MAFAGLCFGGSKIKEPFQSLNGRLLDAVQAGIVDLSAVELFGAEAQQDAQGAAAALQKFWQEVVKSKKTGLSLVGLETFDLCTAVLLEPNSISRSVLEEKASNHAEFFTKAIFERIQAQGNSATKKVLYESLSVWLSLAPGKTKKAKDLNQKASAMVQDHGMTVGPPHENIQVHEGDCPPPDPKTGAEDWLQQLLSIRPKPLVLRGTLADWQLLPVLLLASSQPPSDSFSFKELLATLAGTFGRSFSGLTQAVTSAVSDASIRLGKLGRSPPSKLNVGMLRQFSQEVVKGALRNLQATELRLFGAGAIVLKAIAVFLDQADREPRVEESDSDESVSESARPSQPPPTVLSTLEGHAWNILMAMIFSSAAPKLKAQVHPGFLLSVLKPAFGAIAGEVPLSTGLSKEQEDVVCSAGQGFIETARSCLRHFAAKADDSEVLRFMHAGFVRRQGLRDLAQLGFDSPPARSRANTEIEVRAEPAPSPKPRLSIRRNPGEEAKLRAIFDQCDTNGDGTLNKRELILMCRSSPETAMFFGLPAVIRQEDGSRDLLEAKFQMMDQNDDREVNYDEFREWYESEILLEQERKLKAGDVEAEPKMTSEEVRVNVKKSIFGEDDTDSEEDERPPAPVHTGVPSIQHVLTNVTSDGRPLMEEDSEEEVQPLNLHDERLQAEKFLEFIFDQVKSQREDEQGITRRDLEAALAASWDTYGRCFEHSDDDVSEDLALQPLGPLEFLDHFLSLDPAEPLHGMVFCQPPPEPWPEIRPPKKKATDIGPPQLVEEGSTPVETMVVEEVIAMPAAEVIESATAVDPNSTDPSDAIPAPHRGMEIHEDLMVSEELTEPVPTVTEIPMIEPAETTQWMEQTMVIGASDSEDEEASEGHPAEHEAANHQDDVVQIVDNLASEDDVTPRSKEDEKVEALPEEQPDSLQRIEVTDDWQPSKPGPPQNWFSDDVVPTVPPPPVLPAIVTQQDPSGGLPLIPSARGNAPERQALGDENTSESQIVLPSSDSVLPALTFTPDAVVQSPSHTEHQVAIRDLSFEASPVQDVGSAPPESARTEPLSMLTPRTDLEVTASVSEAPLSLSPAPEHRLATVSQSAQSQEQLVPFPQEGRRSSVAIREQLQMQPTSQPLSLQPAKPQADFAHERLSQICLRSEEADPKAKRNSTGSTGSTIHDDFRQLPRKLQEQVANLYQELEDAKDCKRRAEQENTEILNYLSAIINDDIPEQYALMDGSVSAVPSGVPEDEKQPLKVQDDEARGNTTSPMSPEQLEPPPPLPFASEHVQASTQAPLPPPDFLSKPLVNINFGGNSQEGWGSSHEPRRSEHVLQDSLASVLPMAFRQLFERPSLTEQHAQDAQERQHLQQSLQLMQQQLQQLQQQISQGKTSETPQPSQRSLLEQLRAELAAERREIHEQQRQQLQQDHKQQFQQQQVQELLEQKIHQLQLQVQQQQQAQQKAQQEAEQQSLPLQKMLEELRTNGEATIGELRAALEELRQSKERLVQAPLPPLPFSFDQETCSRPRSPNIPGMLHPFWEEKTSPPPSLLRGAPKVTGSSLGALSTAGTLQRKSELSTLPHYLAMSEMEALRRLPAQRRRMQPLQPLQVSRSQVFDKELARWDSRAEQLESRFRRLHSRRS